VVIAERRSKSDALPCEGGLAFTEKSAHGFLPFRGSGGGARASTRPAVHGDDRPALRGCSRVLRFERRDFADQAVGISGARE
jgi:hypothetical protein